MEQYLSQFQSEVLQGRNSHLLYVHLVVDLLGFSSATESVRYSPDDLYNFYSKYPLVLSADLLPTTGNLPWVSHSTIPVSYCRNSKGESVYRIRFTIWNQRCSRSGIVQPTRYYHRYQTICVLRRNFYRSPYRNR